MFGTTNTGMTGIQFQNTSVTFSLQSTPDFADYPYRGQFANSGITAQAYAEVVYSSTQASSGDYAPFCQTYNGGVYLYAKTNVGTQTIPTIAVGTASFSLTMDNLPTSGSTNPVSSGGVYDAIPKEGTLTVSWTPTNRASSVSGYYRLSKDGWLEIWLHVYSPSPTSYGSCRLSWNKVQFNSKFEVGTMGFNPTTLYSGSTGIDVKTTQITPVANNDIDIYCGDGFGRSYYISGYGSTV